MRNLALLWLPLLGGMLAFALPGDKPKLSPDLARAIEYGKPGQTAEIIVQFEEVPGAAERKKVEALGGKELKVFASIRAAIYSIPLANIKKLSEDPAVTRISPNRHVSVQKAPPAASVLIDGDKD